MPAGISHVQRISQNQKVIYFVEKKHHLSGRPMVFLFMVTGRGIKRLFPP